MAFAFAKSQLDQITHLRDLARAGTGLYADAYTFIANAADGQDAVDPRSIIWFRGASDVNAGIGPFSHFIRTYTDHEHFVRFGTHMTPTELQTVSNQIAEAVITDVLTSKTVPSLGDIAANDASLSAANYFGGNEAIWSGNLLFLFLARDQEFVDTLITDQPGNAYDLLASIDSAKVAGLSTIGYSSATQLESAVETVWSAVTAAQQSLIGKLIALAQTAITFADAYFQASSLLDSIYHSHVTVASAAVSQNLVLGTTTSSDTLVGTGAQDVMLGEFGNDSLLGAGGNDVLDGGVGNDLLNGGAGEDIAIYRGACDDYTITHNANGSWTIADKVANRDGTDTLFEVEDVQFKNMTARLEDGRSICGGQDVCFVIDTTGSMSDDIDSVKVSASHLIDGIFSAHDGDQSRVAVVGFKDPGEDETILSFTNQSTIAARESAALSAINSIVVGGGGDTPEGHYSALLYALTGGVGDWREDASVRRIVLFSDAPPKDQYLEAQVNAAAQNVLGSSASVTSMSMSADGLTADITVSATAADGTPINRGVEIYTVLVGNDTSADTALQTIADENRGLSLHAAGASDVVDTLTEAVTTPYLVPFNGTGGNDTLFGTLVDDRMVGLGGNDSIYGNDGNDFLLGEAGNDFLFGGPGNDILDGGPGNDTLTGDGGNDTYFVDAATDRVIENAGEGYDTVVASVNYTLPVNVEQLELADGVANGTGGADANTLIGNSGNNVLDGGGGADVMIGRAGNDIYFVDSLGDVPLERPGEGTDQVWSLINGYTLTDNVEVLVLLADVASGNGNGANNNLIGNAAANTLDGGGGADVMTGKGGDDIYYVDNPGDVVVENPGEGNDTIRAFINYALPANVERLELQGFVANGDGNDAANTLIGNDNANVLNGNGGPDLMIGRGGDDTYYVDNPGDVVLESPGSGNDQVWSFVSYTLTDNVERLELLGNAANGTGNAGPNTIIGNAAGNILNGGAGADLMIGRGGDDTYFVDNPGDIVLETPGDGNDQVLSFVNYTLPDNVERLQLFGAAVTGTGNAGPNTIIGNPNANIINGGAGADVMLGGPGDDTYFVDNPGDTVLESPGEGSDQIWSFVDYALPANTERLELLGTGAINGSGNSAANTLIGNDNSNVLNGNAGADLMIGRGGNDIYFVDDTGDIVLESPGGGNDQIWSYVDYTLTDNVEGLTLLGNAVRGTGNAGANTIIGNTQNNILKGNGGADTFVFHTGFGKDTITDFTAGPSLDDIVQFRDGLFASFADVMAHAAQVGSNVVITHDPANTLTLNGVSLASLHANDFLFT